MAISKDFFTSNYRTHVLNDFSVVAKAMFYGLEKNGTTYTLKDKLPVQINPSDLEYNRNSSVACNRGIINGIIGTKKESEPNTLKLTLNYDIYDEYNVRTNYGMTGAVDNGISLFNKEFTSLPKLQSYANDENMFVFFIWGDINFFGRIESVSCTYDVFSQWGNPLSARVEVYVKESKIVGSTEDELNLKRFSEDISKAIKGYEDTMKVVNTTALAGMDLASEVSGIALEMVQGALR